MQQLQRIDVHGLSSAGDAHEVNHDHFAIASLNKSMRVHHTNLSVADHSRVDGNNQGHVFLVADGISGGPSPARASRTAVDSVVHYFLNEMPWYHLAAGEPEDVTLALKDALWNSQCELQRGGESRMGTTLTLAFVSWPDLFVAHVGDSRCYLQRGRMLRQLTTDHTLAHVRESLPGGRPTERGASTLWNALGGPNEELHPDVGRFTLEPGDTLALVTDGVHGHRGARELRGLFDDDVPAEELCKRLVERGHSDDSTAVVARFLPGEPESATRPGHDPLPDLAAARRPNMLLHDDIEPKTPRALNPRAELRAAVGMQA